MAHTRNLNARHLGAVRSQLARIAHEELRSPTRRKPALGESFEMYMLPGDRIPKSAKAAWSLVDNLQRTGQWHHQVLVNDKPTAAAHSGALGPAHSEWSLQGVFASKLAGKIDDAIKKIHHRYPQGDVMVRLVEVPAFHVSVFSLEGKGTRKVYVVDSPYDSPGPKEGRTYSEQQFLKCLNSVPQVRGLVPE